MEMFLDTYQEAMTEAAMADEMTDEKSPTAPPDFETDTPRAAAGA